MFKLLSKIRLISWIFGDTQLMILSRRRFFLINKKMRHSNQKLYSRGQFVDWGENYKLKIAMTYMGIWPWSFTGLKFERRWNWLGCSGVYMALSHYPFGVHGDGERGGLVGLEWTQFCIHKVYSWVILAFYAHRTSHIQHNTPSHCVLCSLWKILSIPAVRLLSSTAPNSFTLTFRNRLTSRETRERKPR